MARARLPPHRPAEDGDDVPPDGSSGSTGTSCAAKGCCCRATRDASTSGRRGSCVARTRGRSPGGAAHRVGPAAARRWRTGRAGAGVSHEFFAAASARAGAARGRGSSLRPRCTWSSPRASRSACSRPAGRRALKNRETTPMADYGRDESDEPARHLELAHPRPPAGARSGGRPPAARSHPSTCTCCRCRARTPRARQIWHRFAGLLGVDPGGYDLSGAFANESMGVVEAETLRRVNEHLGDFTEAIDRGIYIRTFLADERLVPRGGERFWPGHDQVEDCRRGACEAVAFVREQGYDVVGDARRPARARPAARAPPAGLGHRRRGRRGRGRAGGDDARRRPRPAPRTAAAPGSSSTSSRCRSRC